MGGTASTNFPTTAGAYDRTFNKGGTATGGFGDCDVFVSKFSPSGQLLWSTLVGGPNYDRAYAVEVDAAGHVIVAGRAGPGFPTTAGVFQPVYGGTTFNAPYGSQNGFVFKLAANGASLVWSSYVGVGELCRDVAVDADGEIYLPLGWNTQSGDVTAPTWFATAFANAFRSTPPGNLDCGVVKISADGAQVRWATWMGGSGEDSQEGAIRVDALNRVYLGFNTRSANVPTAGSGADTSHNGGVDSYVATFSSDGSKLLMGTYIGGAADDWLLNTHPLAIDPAGNAYIAVASGSANYPTTPGVLSRTRSGAQDMALSKISPDGTLVLSTFINGSAYDNPDGLHVDAAGNVLVTGETQSSDFPRSTNAVQRVKGANTDGFVLRVSADFSRVLYGTFLGGGANDKVRSCHLDANGSLYIAGTSSGAGWPLKNAHQANYAGGTEDVILFKFTAPDPSLRCEFLNLQSTFTQLRVTSLTPGIPYTLWRSVDAAPGSWQVRHTWMATELLFDWLDDVGESASALYRARSGTALD